MTTLNDIVARIRAFDPERSLGLRAPLPPIVLEIDRGEVTLVRMRPRRGKPPLLEAHAARPVPEGTVPASIFQTVQPVGAELSQRLRELFETSGTRPGRVSVVLPDNLAKISLLHLPERPASPRRLDELVRAKMRRSVPFRIDDARLTYQVFGGAERGVVVLVVLVRRALVEQLEAALESVGARPGLIDLSTTNLLNLSRARLEQAGGSGEAAALLNCAANYFSLVIVRGGRLIFYRCKTFSIDAEHEASAGIGLLGREVANSLAYYREKLEGNGLAAVLVRTVGRPFDEIAGRLRELGCGSVEPIDPSSRFEVGALQLDGAALQRIAPAIGAAVGRGR